MNTKHTPGPWEAVEIGVIAQKITSHGNFYICSLIDPENEEDKANARLIAAAPELLEALKQIANHFDMDGYGPDAWKKLALEMAETARAAIARAEGNGAEYKNKTAEQEERILDDAEARMKYDRF